MSNYIKYQEIVSHLPLKKGDILNVSSDILKLICVCKENGERFDPNIFIDCILEKVGPTGTVLFPTFFWNFCRGQVFDLRRSPSQTGGLSNVALKRSDFKRTRHPIYSFAVWGRDQDFLCQLNNVTAFGKDSPFGYLYDQSARGLYIGVDYKDATAIVHYAEERVGVDYREQKAFTAPYIDENGVETTKTYSFYVRLPNCGGTLISSRLDSPLLEEGNYFNNIFNGVQFGLINLRPMVEIMIRGLENGEDVVSSKEILHTTS